MQISFSLSRSKIVLLAVLVLAISGAVAGYFYFGDALFKKEEQAQAPAKDARIAFVMEIYDIITREYWQKAEDAKLAELFRLSLNKASGKEYALASTTRAGFEELFEKSLREQLEDKKNTLAIDTATVALANLAPMGRSGLLSAKQDLAFRDAANNIDRSKNLYAELGVREGAPVEEVKKAYEAKKTELEASTTPEAAAELKEITHAKEVLTDASTKAVYDTHKIEPTLLKRVIGTSVLYIDMSKVSPATFNEFIATFQNIENNPAIDSMIIDVRGNIGGSLDFVKYLLALFIGPNQYAFDLWHQDAMQVERTPMLPKIVALDRIKEIAILTDGMTQSTAELTSAVFKRMNRAKIVGSQTRGWGSVENTFPIQTSIDPENTYSVLLVHSLTLDELNQPIEERGVAPTIDIKDSDWKQKVSKEFNSRALRAAIISLF